MEGEGGRGRQKERERERERERDRGGKEGGLRTMRTMEIKAEPSNYCVSQYYDSSLIKQCTKELRHITSQLILRSFLFSLMRRMEDNWPVIPHRAAKPVRRIQPNTGCVEKLYQGEINAGSHLNTVTLSVWESLSSFSDLPFVLMDEC